jgi:hypothetical protein
MRYYIMQQLRTYFSLLEAYVEVAIHVDRSASCPLFQSG